MKTFEVYQHPTQSSEAVKEGFSWPAFFFGPAWLLFKQLWLFAVAGLALLGAGLGLRRLARARGAAL